MDREAWGWLQSTGLQSDLACSMQEDITVLNLCVYKHKQNKDKISGSVTS